MGDLSSIKTKKIFVFDAEPGMVLAKDLIMSDGSLFMARGTVLDVDIISKISGNHILEICIVDAPYSPPKSIESIQVAQEEQEQNATYYEKIRNTKSFKEFNKGYTIGISDLKTQLNEIATKNIEIDEAALLKNSEQLLSTYTNRLQMFDFIHSLKAVDDLTYTHSINVALVASIIGQWLHFSQEDVRIITLCGLLHDVGKVIIPDEILYKPEKLTGEEFEIMKSHVNLGYDILKQKNIDARVKEACLLHHEKCNGTGYPFGITNDKIPVYAKIIAVADIYDAMTSNRVYRGAVCPFTVIRMMEQECFSTLDPSITLPFLRNVVTSYLHTNVRLSDGQIGEVMLVNEMNLSRPSISCNGKFIDLSKTRDLMITAII